MLQMCSYILVIDIVILMKVRLVVPDHTRMILISKHGAQINTQQQAEKTKVKVITLFVDILDIIHVASVRPEPVFGISISFVHQQEVTLAEETS